jgi:uncharacterized LabA/DUF88 family protein
MNQFNTAIFYDLENLLKGYNFSQQLLTNLSLVEILESIRATNRLGKVALQRAYANWSDPRLASLRGEVNDLGIDPIQVFGFARDSRKNAADIQMAIDAIDLAHTRPGLEIFVIVSGDGGFSALARKLHEYGKTVIGCAYQSAANRTFRAVCDEFVWLADPIEEERGDRSMTGSVGYGMGGPSQAAYESATGPRPSLHPLVTDPRNHRLASHLRSIGLVVGGAAFGDEPPSFEQVVEKTRAILKWYASDPESRRDLSRSGIHLNVVQEAVRSAIPGFQAMRYGFAKFIEYLQCVCRDTEVGVVRPPSPQAQAILMLREAVRDPSTILPDLQPRDLHSPENYAAILAYGNPILRMTSITEWRAVTSWMIAHPAQRIDLGSLIESASLDLEGVVNPAAIKQVLLNYVAADVFLREPEGLPISEQRLTLRPDYRHAEHLREALRRVAFDKLVAGGLEPRAETLERLLPSWSGEVGLVAARGGQARPDAEDHQHCWTT